ncbi:hypothetical protein [Streptomyces sp. A012304]|uniref:hypothetical protein n=1 Tax=Streptomyces sp. A012304 TaxID=375446 RepID=UPI0022306BDE|nr:hypothetical protein [Streptomyces sp. A012304]
MLALTGYAVLSGDGGGSDTAGNGGATPSTSSSATASPAPAYTQPEDWTEPERWAALPRGSRTDKYGSQVGFPHTTEGAVGMMVTSTTGSVEPGKSALDGQMRVYRSYIRPGDHSDEAADQIEQSARETDRSLHQQMGVLEDSELPPGSYVRTTVIGYKVIQVSDDEVGSWLLAKVVTKKGELEKETSEYIRLVMGAVWESGDWKLSGQASARASQQGGSDKPGMATPGDAKFNEIGWTAIREAS